MNGPAHYAKAELLLDEEANHKLIINDDKRARLIAAAQAHATLAQVALTHDINMGAVRPNTREQWAEVTR